MYLTLFAVLLAAVVGHTDCHLSNSEQTTKQQMSIELINPKPLHAINALAISCIEPYDTHFCLNGGRCFNVTVATYSFPSCECAIGFLGERCERKYLERSYNQKHYMKADDTIATESWSNVVDKSFENFNSMRNIAGDTYVGSGAVRGISVTVTTILSMLLLHLLIFVLVAV